ncbi:MAG: thiolase domain-containing protein [Thermoplasmatales archaeon]|nr:thiolase domain-containing protein [Thermoplasmatales archaeon]
MRDVYILGVGTTKFGELWDLSLRELASEAGLKAIMDAGIYAEDVDALYGANTSGGQFVDQEQIAALIADYSGISDLNIPSIRVEAGSASGGAALMQAYLAVKSGQLNTVVVGGVEKMTDVPSEVATEIIGGSLDAEWETFFGATECSIAAMIARRHEFEGKAKRENYAVFPVISHKHASMNDTSHFKNIIKIEDVINASPVAEPLTVFDNAPISDGASALVISADLKKINNASHPIKIKSSSAANDFLSVHDRKSVDSFRAVKKSSDSALSLAGLDIGKIDALEIHDSYSIAALIQLEEILGKDAIKMTEGNDFYFNSSRPLNVSGGLKAHGNPLGTSGLYQAVEATVQLRGKAGQRQVKDPRNFLIHNMGGLGTTSVSTVIGVD